MPKRRPPSLAQKKKALVRALGELEHDVEQLPRDFEYVIHPGKHLLLTYLRGIVYGLGAITAVVIVIPVIVWILHGIEWVPIVGDFINRVATQVEQVRVPR